MLFIRILGIIVIMLFLIAVFFRWLGYFILNVQYGRRLVSNDKNDCPILRDFPGLMEHERTFRSGQNTLTGFFYYSQKVHDCKGIVVVIHGHQLFHQDYLCEINYFAQQGYLVYAYDCTGCGESEGEAPLGYPQWTLDLHAALSMLENDDQCKKYSIYLFGHSMGACAVGCVHHFSHPRVKAAVACSPMNSGAEFAKVFWQMFPSVITKQTYIAMRNHEIKRFGSYSDYTVVSGINNTEIPIIVLHSKDDKTVPLNCSLNEYISEITNKNFKFILLDDKKHFVFKNEASCQYYSSGKARTNRQLGYGLNLPIMKYITDLFDRN